MFALSLISLTRGGPGSPLGASRAPARPEVAARYRHPVARSIDRRCGSPDPAPTPAQKRAVIVVSVVTARRARNEDTPRLWALNNLPNIGATADPTMPIDLLTPEGHPLPSRTWLTSRPILSSRAGTSSSSKRNLPSSAWAGSGLDLTAGRRCSGSACTRPGDDLVLVEPLWASWRSAPGRRGSSGCT